jgi:hypothetical protein
MGGGSGGHAGATVQRHNGQHGRTALPARNYGEAGEGLGFLESSRSKLNFANLIFYVRYRTLLG